MEVNVPISAYLRRRVALPDPESPTSPGMPSPAIEDDPALSEYESSSEDTNLPTTSHQLLNKDPFGNETSRILFDSIDELRKWGAGRDLELPQLVIVGKQSAGKSSLLQSLTDIPFPVGSRLCTRFATRIVSRRTLPGSADVVKASIEPGDINPFNYQPDHARLRDFEQIIPNMTAEAFETLIEKAKEVMGINSNRGSDHQNFSSMVLKIELAGPKRSHFGILDVPGVFSAATRNVKKHEMDGVTALVSSYMKRQANIIICVADATDDLANQQIFTLASEHVDDSRIVGVFTKCDQTQHPETIVQIVKDGEGIPNKSLRWYVVQNRGPKSSADFDREQEEKATFSEEPWLEIPAEQRGTPMLKSYLANLLCNRIREAFPGMQETVRALLQTERSNRRSFGEARVTHAQRLVYLMHIVERYQDLAIKALTAPGDLPVDEMKLRGFTEAEKDRFTNDMTVNGHRYKFLDIGNAIETEYDPDCSESEDESDRLSVPIASLTTRGASNRRGFPLTPETSPRRQLPRPNHIPARLNPLYAEIRKQMSTNRGEELPGMLNPAVLKPLWRKQTSKWEDLGEKHLNTVVSITTKISLQILDTVASDIGMTERAIHKLQATISGFSDEGRATVLSQLHELCHKNASMALQTNDPAFQQSVREAQLHRFEDALDRFQRDHATENYLLQIQNSQPSIFGSAPLPPRLNLDGCKDWKIVTPDNIMALFNQMHPNGSRTQNTEDEIHDILKAYYDISLQNHLYDLNRNILEPFLISPTGPLKGLSTAYILSLSEAEIEDLGGEDERIVKGRENCEVQIEKLERAVAIAGEAWRRTRVGGF